MTKKPRVSPLQSFQINTDIETGDLPNLATVQETVALVTGKTVVVVIDGKLYPLEQVRRAGLAERCLERKRRMAKDSSLRLQALKNR